MKYLNHKYSKLLLLLLLILNLNVFGQQKHKLYVSLDLNGCNSCNHLVSSLESKPIIFANTTIVLNSDEINNEQADNFLQNIFSNRPKYIIDSVIFNTLAKSKSSRKLPTFSLSADSCKSAICTSTIDSLDYYLPFINSILESEKTEHKEINYLKFNTIKGIFGWKNIESLNNKYIVSSYQLEQKFYIINNTNQTIDSFYLNDKQLTNFIYLNTGKSVDINKLKKYYKQLGLPSLYSINTTPIITDNKYLNSFTIVYFRNEPNDSIIESEFFNYLFEYDLLTKKTTTVKQEYIDTTLNLKIHNLDTLLNLKVIQDNYYLKKITDKNWEIILDGNTEIINNYSKLKIKAELQFDKASKQLKLSKINNVIYIDSAFTFDNEPMNKPNMLYQYMITENYFAYKLCPTLLKIDEKLEINLTKYDTAMHWIHAISEDQGVLKVLYQKRSGGDQKLLIINNVNTDNYIIKELKSLNDFLIKKKQKKQFSSNINFGLNNSVVYIDKQGNIVESIID